VLNIPHHDRPVGARGDRRAHLRGDAAQGEPGRVHWRPRPLRLPARRRRRGTWSRFPRSRPCSRRLASCAARASRCVEWPSSWRRRLSDTRRQGLRSPADSPAWWREPSPAAATDHLETVMSARKMLAEIAPGLLTEEQARAGRKLLSKLAGRAPRRSRSHAVRQEQSMVRSTEKQIQVAFRLRSPSCPARSPG